MPTQFTCCRCGRQFPSYPSQAPKYCSMACFQPSRGATITDRLMARGIRADNGCLIWTGCVDRRGYGKIGINRKKRSVYVVAYEIWVGTVPDGLQVQHLCNNPPCFEPSHLTVGTAKQNGEYMVASGRSLRGIKRPPEHIMRGTIHHNAKVTEETVAEMRARYAAGGIMYKELATEYGIHATTVGEIIRREIWQHVA